MEEKIDDNKKNIFGENSKNIWKFLILIFIFNVIIFNWNDIYWLFNPHVAPKGIQTLVKKNEAKQETKKETPFYDKEDSIEISAINITAPIIVSNPITDDDFKEALEKGVVHFPESDLPGEKGTSILLGHSAPPGWPKIDYEWVFSDLEKLEKGDEITIYFENNLYNYIVEEKIFLDIGEDIPSYISDDSEMILLSCWPPGKNVKRIGIRAFLN